MSLQNFWYLLQPTWLQQIQTQYPNNANKSNYIKQISTGNNSNWSYISITSPTEQTIFFTTLSLVFNLTFQILTISNCTHITNTINACNQDNDKKSISVRQSINSATLFEPWFDPQILVNRQLPVFLFYNYIILI